MITIHGMRDCIDCLILKNWLILYDIPFKYISDIKKDGGRAPQIITPDAVLVGLDECLEWIEIKYDVKFKSTGYGRPC